nr:MAG TPA: peptidase [Caudoviricetes sp.]
MVIKMKTKKVKKIKALEELWQGSNPPCLIILEYRETV